MPGQRAPGACLRLAVADLRDLHPPFPDAAENLHAWRWSDEDHAAALPVAERADAPLDLPDLWDAGVGRSAVREPPPAVAVLRLARLQAVWPAALAEGPDTPAWDPFAG